MSTALSGASRATPHPLESGTFVRSATEWRPEAPPRSVEFSEACRSRAIRWFDVDPTRCRAQDLVDALRPCCDGLTLEMARDLLTPDAQPEGKPFNGHVRLASTFAVEASRSGPTARRGEGGGAGHLLFKPLEILAGANWMITCWHPSRTFVGAHEDPSYGPASAPPDLVESVGTRWVSAGSRCAGDLGVLVMHELALTYVPAVRCVASWLEDWELALYVTDEPDRSTLARIWGSMAVLRDWLNPLNRAGLRTDLNKAWLPAVDHDEVVRVDDRVDKALDNLRGLADALRASFQLLHVELNEEQRDHAERLQRRVELIATALLVPTLVVGFYGANTWVPGEGRHWGFWVMVGALVMLTLGALGLVQYVHRAHQRDADGITRERRRLQAELRRA